MKKLNFIALAIIGLYACLNFSSCKKDDDDNPSISSIKGVWCEGRVLNSEYEEDDIMDLLITDNVWLWGESARVLSNYKNSSFDELAKRFAPDDEFLIYRYDSKNDVYLLYESGDFINGELFIHIGYFDVVKINVKGNSMDLVLYDYITNPNAPDENQEWPYPAVSYKEILNDPQYATMPSNIDLGEPEYITYSRYNN